MFLNYHSKMPKSVFLKTIAIFIFFLCLFAGRLHAADLVDRIVAVVNDEVITQSELEESMLPFVADYKIRYGEEELQEKIDEARADALNRLIEEKLILQEARRRGIIIDEEEVEERLEDVKARFKTEDNFKSALEESGISLSKLRQRYGEQIMMKTMVSGLINARVHVSPTEVAAYYYAHPEDFTIPETVRFKVLLLKPVPSRNMQQTESLALKLLDRVRSGEDFDALVKQYSKGPNVDKGGDMGYMPAEAIVLEVREEIAKLEPGEISGLVMTSAGYNIIKLIDRKTTGTQELSQVQDLIRERLFQREAELTLREFVNQLKEDAYIEIQEEISPETEEAE